MNCVRALTGLLYCDSCEAGDTIHACRNVRVVVCPGRAASWSAPSPTTDAEGLRYTCSMRAIPAMNAMTTISVRREVYISSTPPIYAWPVPRQVCRNVPRSIRSVLREWLLSSPRVHHVRGERPAPTARALSGTRYAVSHQARAGRALTIHSDTNMYIIVTCIVVVNAYRGAADPRVQAPVSAMHERGVDAWVVT